MAEKYSSDELVINDLIDEGIYGILSDEPIGSSGEEPELIKDSVAHIIEENSDIAQRMDRRNREEQVRTDSMSKELKSLAHKEKKTAFWRAVGSVFLPATWIKFIQYWEDLILVLFVDISLLCIIFSFMVIVYIIVAFNDGSNLLTFLCKLGGAVILAALSMIIQININPQKKDN